MKIPSSLPASACAAAHRRASRHAHPPRRPASQSCNLEFCPDPQANQNGPLRLPPACSSPRKVVDLKRTILLNLNKSTHLFRSVFLHRLRKNPVLLEGRLNRLRKNALILEHLMLAFSFLGDQGHRFCLIFSLESDFSRLQRHCSLGLMP